MDNGEAASSLAELAQAQTFHWPYCGAPATERNDSHILLRTNNNIAARHPIMVEDPENHDFEGTIVVFGTIHPALCEAKPDCITTISSNQR